MKKNTRVVLESVCLIAAVAAVAAIIGNQETLLPTATTSEESIETTVDKPDTSAQSELEQRIATLPDSQTIDITDESQAEAMYQEICAIYALAEENKLTLTPEQEAKIKAIIETYQPSQALAAMTPIPSSGGTLSAGTYALQQDTSLEELDLLIPSGAEVTIDLNGHLLTGTGQSSVLTVENGGTLTIKDSSFYPVFRGGSIQGGTGTKLEQEGGTQSLSGGGIFVQGSLQLQSGTITNCTANSGGGVYISDGGTFLMTGGTIEGCSVSGEKNVYGGGVQVSGSGSFQMDGGTIANCSVLRQQGTTESSFGGGGVGVYNGSFLFHNGIITDCSSDYHGGGIYVSEQSISVAIAGGSIENCQALSHGGGLYVLNNEAVIMTGGSMKHCSAYGGGAVCIQGEKGAFQFTDGTLTGMAEETEKETGEEENHQAAFGGGIYVLGGTLHLSGGTISDFSASTFGGGVYVGFGGTLTMEGSVFSNCKAEKNGGGIYFNGTEATISSGTIQNCSAKENGGGIYILGGIATFSGDSIIDGCMANGAMVSSQNTGEMTLWDGGGGIFAASNAVIYLTGGTITQCESASFGGGIFSYGTLFASGGTIDGCRALGGGGILLAENSRSSFRGGTIQNCHAVDGNGGGISFSDGTLAIQQNPVILNNTKEKDGQTMADNLYLPEERHISIDGPLTEGASIGVSLSPAAFVTDKVAIATADSLDETDLTAYFVADMEQTSIASEAETLYLVYHPESLAKQ